MFHHEDEEEGQQHPSEALANRILKTRSILVMGQIDQDVAERVISQLLILDADNHDPIRMIITSQGGHVDSGFAIHDMMMFVESPVYTIGAGWVASIAVPILLGAEKDHRFALPNTRFLLHQPSGGAGGQLSDIRIEAQEIIKIRTKINEMLAVETGQTVERIAHDSDRNFWMSAEEAKKYGIISKIVKNVKDIK